MSGATKAWNVKIADVGNPGSTISGVFPITARQSGLRVLGFPDQRDFNSAVGIERRGASASMAKNPSACENAITAPELFPLGNAMRPSSAPTSETSTNSSRPSSDGMRTGCLA